jgi:hypothetical protein
MMPPGWNSIDSVRRIHDAAEVIGIILFGLIVVAELCQFFYGKRDRYLTDSAAQQAERRAEGSLTKEQKQTLIAALSPFHGQKVWIECLMDDRRGKNLAEQFLGILTAAHWDFGGKATVSEAAYNPEDEPVGIRLVANKAQWDEKKPPPALLKLGDILFELGLIKEKMIYMSSSDPPDVIGIKIGKEPSGEK